MPPRLLIPFPLVESAAERAGTDEDLARALQNGEPWALAETWRRFAPMVLTFATRALGSVNEAEDLAQEVFYRVFRKAKTLRDPSSLRSFVFSFALRLLKTELRHRRTRRWLSFHPSETLPEIEIPAADVESTDLLRRFYALLERLGTRDRMVFSLRYLEKMTVEEIANNLEISVSTVKRALLHATKRLSQWMEKDFGELRELALQGGWHVGVRRDR